MTEILETLEERRKRRDSESKTPLSQEESEKLYTILKEFHKQMSLDRLAQMMNIPSWRQHQIYLSLKNNPDIVFTYEEEEWYAKWEPS